MPVTKPDERERYLAMIENGVPEIEARRACGIARSTGYRWRNPEVDAKLALQAATAAECPECGGRMAKHAQMCRRCRNKTERREAFIEAYNAGEGSFKLALDFGLPSPQAAYLWARVLRRRGFPIERREKAKA